MEDFWPIGGNGHIIITSRNPYVSEFRDSVSLNLPPLSRKESRDLFYKVCGEDRAKEHDEEMEAVLEEWECLPLALYHIGGYINRMHLDIRRFPNLYQQPATRIYRTKYCTDEYPHSIAAAFSTDDLEGDMKTVLRALCYFDPDDIPNELLHSNFDDGQTRIQVETEFE